MPDSPDWSKYLPLSHRFSLQDLGELAARIGSLDVYDRRGEVIWWEDWSRGVNHWSQIAGGSGAAVRLDASNWYLSSYVARMQAGTTLGKSILIYSFLAPLHLSKLGIEVAFAATNEFSHVNLSLYRYDGTTLTKGELRLSDAANELLYLDSGAAYVVLDTGVSIVTFANLFHQMKVVVDMEAGEYVRAFYDETEYDLSGIAARTEANTADARTYLAFELVGITSPASVLYCGQAIVTSNEP